MSQRTNQTVKSSSHQQEGIIAAYFAGVSKYPLLARDDEIDLAKRMEEGDEVARHKFIESNLRLSAKIAGKYLNQCVSLQYLDLVQLGNIGLIRAVDKYDYRRGFRLSTYATWWIRQSIERGIMNYERTVRKPIHICKKLKTYQRFFHDFINDHDRDPTSQEIADGTGFSKEELKNLQQYSQMDINIDAPSDTSSMVTLDRFYSDPRIGADEEIEQKDISGHICDIAQKTLTQMPENGERDWDIMKMRFGIGEYNDCFTLEVIGEKYNITRERVRKIQIEFSKRLRQSASMQELMDLLR